MEVGQESGQQVDGSMHVRPAHHERPEPSSCGEPPHHNDVLAHRPVLAPQDVHTEIDVGGEASVEPDLLPAGELAGCERAKVREAQVQRLLPLKDAVANHQHVGAVRLDELVGLAYRWSGQVHALMTGSSSPYSRV